MAAHRPGILPVAPNAQRPRKPCCRLGHVRIAVRPGGKGRLIIGHRRSPAWIGAQPDRAAGIAFHPARQHSLCLAGRNHGLCQQQRVQPARTLPVDGQPRHALRQSGRQRHHAGRVAPRAKSVRQDQLRDFIRRNPGSGQAGRYQRCGKVLQRQPRKGSAARHDRGAEGGNDKGGHPTIPCRAARSVLPEASSGQSATRCTRRGVFSGPSRRRQADSSAAASPPITTASST